MNLLRLAAAVAAVLVSSVASLGQSVPDLLKALPPRELGPTSMGGRISDIAVYEREPRIFYVATASGGVWKTTNAGTTFSAVFQKEGSSSHGAVAVDQSNPDLVWVGTGEQNSRNSTSWGDGVYKSSDGGKTWAHMGLRDTKHIGKIIIHPKNSDIVWVAALGHLWGENEERGVFKTTDGGKSWQKTLYVNAKTGVVDLEIDPRNPDVLIAGAYGRMRLPWRWESGGSSSGIYKSRDGGKTWRKVTKGVPEGEIGRIGLSVFRKDPKVWIATIEAKAGGTFRSTDGGESWTKVNSINPRAFYFSRPVQDPVDKERIYILGVDLHLSTDDGKTFRTMPHRIHPDHHAMWINPTDPNHMIIGNDGGVAQTRDRGVKWDFLNRIAVGQFYAVAVDMRKPYWVYGGLQDNLCWSGPTQTSRGGVSAQDFWSWTGGDGFHVQVDPDDWTTVYGENQGGALSRLNQRTGESRFIRPQAPRGETYRFNWSSPVIISPHNAKTIYFGGNKLFKSVNRGDTWQVVSPDLTTNDPEKQKNAGGVTPENTGAERHCTIITISESRLKQGLIWVGTDDGKVQVTENDGQTWTDVSASFPGVPAGTWVSRVTASGFKEERAYVTFDGHRSNDYRPYIFVTEDKGKTWTRLGAGLGENQSCYVIKEGLRNENLLFLGTEMGLWVSLDRGANWTKYTAGDFPTVRVDDFVIHPREADLVVATHGRSLWIIPISALEQATKEALEKDVALFKPEVTYILGRTSPGLWNGDQHFVSPNTHPGGQIYYHLKAATTERVSVSVVDAAGAEVASLAGRGDQGLNRVVWRPTRGRITTGAYGLVLKIGDKDVARTAISVEDLSTSTDPNVFIP